MHFSKIAVLVPFVLALAAAAPAAEPAPQPEAIAELEDIEQLHQLTKRGFGCPLNRQECNDHCITLKGGRTGGYCGGFLHLTCKCVKG